MRFKFLSECEPESSVLIAQLLAPLVHEGHHLVAEIVVAGVLVGDWLLGRDFLLVDRCQLQKNVGEEKLPALLELLCPMAAFVR